MSRVFFAPFIDLPSVSDNGLAFQSADDAKVLQRSKRSANAIGASVALCALTSLCGWWLGSESLTALFIGHIPVRPAAALCGWLCGLALALRGRTERVADRLASVFAGAASIVGLLEIVSQGAPAVFSIDRWIGHSFNGAVASANVDTASAVAACFLLEAVALAFMGSKVVPRMLLRGCAGIAVVLASILILGLVNGPEAMNRVPQFAGISVITALFLWLLGVGFFLVTPSEGVGAALLSPLNGGHMARRMLPLVAGLPFLFRLIRVANEQRQFLPVDSLAIGLSALFIVLMSTVVLLNAIKLNQLDGLTRQVAQRNATIASIVASSHDGIIYQDLEGRIVSWNAGATRLYGYADSEAIGMSGTVLWPPSGMDEAGSLERRILKGEEAAEIETTHLRKDGSPLEVNLTLAPIRDDKARVMGTSLIVRDLTRLREFERRFRTMVDAAPISMIMVDPSGTIVLVNALTQNLFGYPIAELIGQPVEMLIPDRFKHGHGRMRTDFFGQAEARMMGLGRDLFGLRKDGSEFPVEIGLNPIETSDGLLTLAAIADITERKRASEALEAYAQELKRSNAELEQFAYVASHDLQEPLRMVVSYMDLLQARYKGSLDEKADKYINYAVDGARRMQRLVSDLLTISRVSSQAKPLVATNAEEVVQWVLRGMVRSISESHAKISVDSLPTVLADEVQLGQVFQNLISNAIKFRSESEPEVHIAASPEGTRWRFTVRDNGIGIDAKYHGRIFQMFQRLHERDRYDGSGIGLSVAQKIVERHGGVLTVDSAPGKGSEFSFTLPGAHLQSHD